VISGWVTAHFRRDLLPSKAQLSWRHFANIIRHHAGIEQSGAVHAESYNVLQRLTYLSVVFVLFPLVIWTGLAMSPALDSAIPAAVTLLGGRQSARTLHFVVSAALVLFLFVHVILVWRAGFWSRMRAMITGQRSKSKESV
jgi:thiosulfate reductase cytochrome b subunit